MRISQEEAGFCGDFERIFSFRHFVTRLVFFSGFGKLNLLSCARFVVDFMVFLYYNQLKGIKWKDVRELLFLHGIECEEDKC